MKDAHSHCRRQWSSPKALTRLRYFALPNTLLRPAPQRSRVLQGLTSLCLLDYLLTKTVIQYQDHQFEHTDYREPSERPLDESTRQYPCRLSAHAAHGERFRAIFRRQTQ